MGRLIDADKFINWLDCGHLRNPSEKCLSELNVKQMIDNQPTAYDVDKVWNEITDRAGKATTKGAYRTYWECAKIVKGAVKDE